MTPATQSFPIGSIVLYMGNRANITGYAADGDVEIRMLNTGSELSVPPDKLSPLTLSAPPRPSRTGLIFGTGLASVLVVAMIYGLFDTDTSEPKSAAAQTSPSMEASVPSLEAAPTTAADPRSGNATPSVAPSYGAGVPAWAKRLKGVKAAYIQPGNPAEANPADRRDTIQIEFTGGDAGQHCTAAKTLAGAQYGIIVTTPTGIAVDSNDCLSVNLDTP
ncbi:hypothetical protein DY245_14795 [Streptomyces inhibens]|uniref:Uncharacterized protein n=1 Tax=Streptomyces inhibens TaxID=2293571 RepID=A0A371Q4H5_STRIH|nr:hypothetical protein [Streptomyces inhibens]REK89607.1 hypothetical protein DY245_14795 [Streptomyces inhibens]